VTYQFANDAVTRQVKIVQGVGDPNQGTTNHKTPLAQALLGCKEGDVTVFLSPFGEKEIRIIAITKDEKF
jgi:transcription elongation GreA/GreB family factor